MNYPSSENKGAYQLRGYREATAKLICVFVFAYADCWFSHGAAHLGKKPIPKLFSGIKILCVNLFFVALFMTF